MVHLAEPRLSGLARNPAAPTSTLVRLAAHAAGRAGLRRRKGPLPDPVADAMLTHGGRDAATLLRPNRISPAVRRRIAEHPDPAIRDAHADFVRTMVARGVPLGLDALVDAYGLPPEELAAHGDPKVRAVLAQDWHDRPPAVHEMLLTDPDPDVRAAAARAQHLGIPSALTERCLADPAVRTHIVHRLPLTQEQFERLLATGDPSVLASVAAHPALTPAMVARLEDSEDPSVRVAVAYSRHVTPDTRDRLLALVEAESAAGGIDAEVALHWSSYRPAWLRDAPLAERLSYLDCPHPAFRKVLATSPGLPEEAWRRLDEDPVVSVRFAAARRHDVPAEVLLRLVREHGDPATGLPGLVAHPRFPRHELRGLAEEPDPRVRFLALEDPLLPAAVMRRLGGAEEAFLRAGVARHPNIEVPLLERLLSDPDPDVVEEAAANPALPEAWMDRVPAEADL
ncbi:hypothetical protein [Streptomyces sp. NPDC096351]|uniref:hypothetical protein n=1 Tax=Streptomyces sp. NPDC096351 TaxID=3366087 RepID=UPI00382BDA23